MKMEGRSDEMLAAALLQYAEERTVEIRDVLDKIIRVIAAVEKTRIGKANETWACVDVGNDLVASKDRVKALLLEYAAVIDKGVDIPLDSPEGPSHACDVRDMAHILAVHREFLFDELVGRYFTRKSQEAQNQSEETNEQER